MDIAEAHHGIPYLREAVIFLLAAGIVVPVLHRLKVSPVLGYLIVGGQEAFWILSSVVGLILLQATITAGLALLFGLPRHTALATGLLLGQGGEFAFVVVGLAMTIGLIAPEIARFMLIVAGLSMLATPFVSALAKRLSARMEQRLQSALSEADLQGSEGLQEHVLIAGFGRVGRTLARLLDAEKIPYLALDTDPVSVEAGRREGMPVYFGDASRLEMLHRAQLESARALAACRA